MKLFSYIILILFTFSAKIQAHECILSGTNAKEISIYNACLANSKQQTKKSSINESLLKVKLQKLKNENTDLKNKLLDLKIRFNNIKSILDRYVSNIY